MASEPLISIKKPDGTFVKVTMAEFLAMKKQKAAPAVAPTADPVILPSSITEPPAATPQEPSNEPAVVKSVADKLATQHQAAKPLSHVAHNKNHIVELKKEKTEREKPKPLTQTDARSPLEEKITVKSNAPLTSHKRESQVEEVVRKLGFGVSPELLNRFKSLILARLKDIKSPEQMRGQLLQPVKNGGFGLTEQQVEKIHTVIDKVLSGLKSESNKNDVPVLKGKPSLLPMVEPPELPAMAVDVRPKKYTEIYQPVQQPSKPDLVPHDDLVSKLVKESLASEPLFKISSKSAPKQFVQDISAPDGEMGPVEEIRSVTLNDFRKLSGNPEEAAKRLQQKILNLQAESFIWYLDALTAYHNSPLYLEYIQAVSQSLAERKSLANVLMMKNSIKLSEAMALVEMEKSL